MVIIGIFLIIVCEDHIEEKNLGEHDDEDDTVLYLMNNHSKPKRAIQSQIYFRRYR